MTLFPPATRRLVLAGLLASCAVPAAMAQETTIKFQLDWRFEGPAAMFLVPAAKGYFKDEKLNVTVDAGNGSGGTVTRVASGAYDIGFADLGTAIDVSAEMAQRVYDDIDAKRRTTGYLHAAPVLVEPVIF